MNTKQRSLLVNLNRLLIFALTVTGLLIDGFQIADLPYGIALVVWLWLPYCARAEARVLSLVRTRRRPSLDAAKLTSRYARAP